jgi:hypothetical protein
MIACFFKNIDVLFRVAATTEAEGHRELTHHGVLRCLAGGERGGGALICTLLDGPIYQSHTACYDILYRLPYCFELLAIPAAQKVKTYLLPISINPHLFPVKF